MFLGNVARNWPALESLAKIFQTRWWVRSLEQSLSGSSRLEHMAKTPPVPRMSAANPDDICFGKFQVSKSKCLCHSVNIFVYLLSRYILYIMWYMQLLCLVLQRFLSSSFWFLISCFSARLESIVPDYTILKVLYS